MSVNQILEYQKIDMHIYKKENELSKSEEMKRLNMLKNDVKVKNDALNGLVKDLEICYKQLSVQKTKLNEAQEYGKTFDIDFDEFTEIKEFDKFEKELGRPLSPFEFEKINIWIANNVPEEMIEAALKEAVYNDAKSLNYIEKIIYNWQTRGYKSVKDVNTGIKKEAELEKTKELFDYNWLDGE